MLFSVTMSVAISNEWLPPTRLRFVSEFMLECARRGAEDVLLDQTVFHLDRKKFRDFIAILERPPKPSEKLKELLRTKSPWDA